VGSTVELSGNSDLIEAEVLEAHDPPLLGAENDRVPRGSESYVKRFRPMRLGVIELEPGRTPLTLRALSIPGAQAMEVRMLELTLKQ
jgi:hypothetical protein